MKTPLLWVLTMAPGTLAVSSSKSTVKSSVESKAIEAVQTKFQFLKPIPVFVTKSHENADVEKARTDVDQEELSDEQARIKKLAHIRAQVHDEKELVKRWFTWGFWELLVACAACLLVFTEIVFPLVFMCTGRSLLVAAILWFLQNFAFLCTAISCVTHNSAGAKICLVLSVILCAMSFLLLLAVAALRCGKSTPAMEILQTDATYVFRPLSIVIILFLIVQGLLDSSSSDWGALTFFTAMLTLGIVLAVSGVVKDVMSYCLIRNNNWFEEGEFIMSGGDLLQIKHIFWCYTLAYKPKTRSQVYVSNHSLAGSGINNRSRDNARVFEFELDIPIGSSDEQTSKMVQGVMALIQSGEKDGFTAMNGKQYEGQIDVGKSCVYITGIDPSSNKGTMQIKLFGKYYFSKPPQWTMKGTPEPQKSARQMEWQAGWNYQMEWLLLESKKVIDQNSK